MTNAMRMVATMVQLQESHNLQVAADWRLRGLPFHRAIWVECAELLDHFGWKWWKHQTPDLGQVKLEIVDIWHFGLSLLMQEQRVDAALAEQLASVTAAARGESSAGALVDIAEAFRTSVESLALAALRDRTFDLSAFVALMAVLPLEMRELFELYVGKNVLNRFRQDHGYQQGSYRKLWSGQEDNAHLLALVRELDPTQDGYAAALYAALDARYQATT